MTSATKKLNYSGYILIICLGILASISHTQNDILIPCYPEMMHYFSTTPQIMHWQVSLNLFAIAIASPVFGALSDIHGRKLYLIIGFIIFILGCFIIMSSTTVLIFMIGRIIQGIGISAPLTIVIAIIFDHFTKDRASQIVALINGIVTTSKVMIPFIANIINSFMNWKAGLLLMVILSIISLTVIVFAVPNNKVLKSETTPQNFLLTYKHMLSSKKFLIYVFMLAAMASSISAYVNCISIIYIEHLGMSKNSFAKLQLIIALNFSFSSFLVIYLIQKLGSKVVKNISSWIIFLSTISVITTSLLYYNPYFNFASIVFLSSGFAFAIAIFTNSAMSFYPTHKGATSSILASVRLVFTATIIYLAGHYFNTTIIPISTLVVLVAIYSLFAIKKSNHH